jgi:hypothetical protein
MKSTNSEFVVEINSSDIFDVKQILEKQNIHPSGVYVDALGWVTCLVFDTERMKQRCIACLTEHMIDLV